MDVQNGCLYEVTTKIVYFHALSDAGLPFFKFKLSTILIIFWNLEIHCFNTTLDSLHILRNHDYFHVNKSFNFLGYLDCFYKLSLKSFVQSFRSEFTSREEFSKFENLLKIHANKQKIDLFSPIFMFFDCWRLAPRPKILLTQLQSPLLPWWWSDVYCMILFPKKLK